MAPMFGTPGKAAWRLLAAVPFVLLLGIVGIKATAGDPNSPFNKIPGAETIQELGEDAPSSNVNVKLPKSASPKPTASASESTSASASPSATPSEATASAEPTKAVKPTRTPKPSPSSPTPNPPKPTHSPTPTQTPLTEQEKCEAAGKQWTRNILTGKYQCVKPLF